MILSHLSLKSYQVYWITDLIERSQIILVFMVITVLFTLYTGFDYFFENRASLRALVKSSSE